MQLDASCGCKIISVWLILISVQPASYVLFEHRYHVMHIRLPDKHNVANYFCLQPFLLEQSFPSFSMCCCSFAVILLVFIFKVNFSTSLIGASSNFITAVDIVQSYTQGFFCQQVLSMILITFLSKASTGILSKEVFNFKDDITADDVNKFLNALATILLNLSVDIMRMLVTQSFLVYCSWSPNTLYTVVHKL